MFVSNECSNCEIIRWHEQDGTALCPNCFDERETKLIADAHVLKDSSEIFETAKPASYVQEEISGHEWVGAHTYLVRPAILQDGTIKEIREEFKLSTVNPSDRIPSNLFLGKHIFPLMDEDDLDELLQVQKGMTICEGCHYEVNKAIACPNCELVNN